MHQRISVKPITVAQYRVRMTLMVALRSPVQRLMLGLQTTFRTDQRFAVETI